MRAGQMDICRLVNVPCTGHSPVIDEIQRRDKRLACPKSPNISGAEKTVRFTPAGGDVPTKAKPLLCRMQVRIVEIEGNGAVLDPGIRVA